MLTCDGRYRVFNVSVMKRSFGIQSVSFLSKERWAYVCFSSMALLRALVLDAKLSSAFSKSNDEGMFDSSIALAVFVPVVIIIASSTLMMSILHLDNASFNALTIDCWGSGEELVDPGVAVNVMKRVSKTFLSSRS